ncbi:spermatogenesis-associated protein 20-like [Haliotis asinina]|uniref:spermatogenesis-associated protein 20-like n=1 Tax=Haliotis asinina TaxID=109174 RepID=UPI003531EDD6
MWNNIRKNVRKLYNEVNVACLTWFNSNSFASNVLVLSRCSAPRDRRTFSTNFLNVDKGCVEYYAKQSFIPWHVSWSRRHISTSKTMASTSSSQQNRLALEKSPYLLQHASNPVDWYPWGQEAFDKAKAENKVIFLSVGYSTCHWCHVMERESFENEEIGRILNENFVSIKVDREERPDVDRVYMTFIQATSGGGGWPMSVWLTPDLNPIVGGTYFPPNDKYYGRPGFKTILQNIAEKWRTKRDDLEQKSEVVRSSLSKMTNISDKGENALPSEPQVMKCFGMLVVSYDEEMGGFGKAPKFPQPVNFNFLFRFYGSNRDGEEGQHALNMCSHTLKMMAKGGVHDHVAQGFHRYSTDKFWHVPHFEKMLYDQGQLAVSYLDAYQATKDKYFADIAKDIFQYVSRDLSHPAGGFYSAEDADSLPDSSATEKKEGAFCVWRQQELQALLPDRLEGHDDKTEAHLFSRYYNTQDSGNVDPYQDPHDELKMQNVLIVRDDIEKVAEVFNLSVETAEEVLQKCRDVLFNVRLKRPKPHLDNKMVAAWNGLMISGYARGGQVLGDTQYTTRAVKAAEFLQTHMYRGDTGVLLRSCYTSHEDGVDQITEPIEGFVDDYSFVIRGLLDLYEACYDVQWLEWAEQLQRKQNDLFWDSEGGGFFSTDACAKNIIVRMKEDQDGAEPSPNSVSAMNLLRLSHFLHRPEWQDQSEKIFRVFSERLTQVPIAVPELASALLFHMSTPKQIIIAGDRESEDTKSLLRTVHKYFLPNKVLLLADGKVDSFLYKNLDILKTLQKVDGKATAYVCENYSCSLPVNTVEDLEKILESG